MNGDGRVDLVGTGTARGFLPELGDRGWVKMASEATMIAVGNLDGDGIGDLIGLWPAQGGSGSSTLTTAPG